MNKIFAIGDIHGCFGRLCDLIEKTAIDFGRDTVVFLGDYIDRGKESFEVVEYLIDLKKRYNNIVFLMGNHEDMLLKYLAGTDRFIYLANGGQETLESYMNWTCKTETGLIPPEHLKFFKSLSLYYETDDYLFVHAGLKEKVPIKDQGPDDILWIRNTFIESDYEFGKRVVFGHTPFTSPLVEPNKIGIDTGAVYGNKLTCVELPEMIFYQV